MTGTGHRGRRLSLRVKLAILVAAVLGGIGSIPGAIIGGEVDVARRHGEPVGVAQRRTADDARSNIEIARQSADDEKLLIILLAEQGDIGLDLIEQLAHHRRHPVEMTRPGGW